MLLERLEGVAVATKHALDEAKVFHTLRTATAQQRPGLVAGLGLTVWIALLALSFLGVHRGLWTPDEPREAEISREMLLSPGVVPTLNDRPFVEKPPLYYWTVAGAFALAGGPSAASARAVSGLAGFLTLVLVWAWGRRAHSPAVGLLAAVMLATSVQFLVSTHWVLLDPMLMLFTTAAAWAAWELLDGQEGWMPAVVLYLAAILALWTKGLIGPLLLGAGLGCFSLVERHRRVGRRLHLLPGAISLAVALAVLVGFIDLSGGHAAVWQWAWVNHVQRFVHPTTTGHRKPLPYYLWTLPVAVLPWIVPLVDALRPSRWKGAARGLGLKRYAASLVVGMLLVLSASSTKRETYLLPLLPPLFLLLAVVSFERWEESRQRARWGSAWWSQLGVVGFVAMAPAIGAMAYRHRADPLAVSVLVAGLALCTVSGLAVRRQQPRRAAAALLACALVAAAGLAVLPGRTLDGDKDMAPFVAGIGSDLPPGEPVYAVGVDETLEGIVPFVTGRRVVAVEESSLVGATADARTRPPFVVVQSGHGHPADPLAGAPYVFQQGRLFGNARWIGLWRLSQAGLAATRR